MKNIDTRRIPPCRFTADLLQHNRPRLADFKAWHLHPGMLFGAPKKWWGDLGPRPSLHEGVDLCLFLDRWDQVRRLDTATRIPALYQGTIVGLQDDFIGKTLFLVHEWTGSDTRPRLLTAYGHLQLKPQLRIGQTVAAGEVIGSLAATATLKSGISAHLHLSVAQLHGTIDFQSLDWQIISNHPRLTLLDPLDLIDGHGTIPSDTGVDARY